MIRHGVPEVKLHLRLVQVTVYLSMMCDGASVKTALRGNTTAIGTTSQHHQGLEAFQTQNTISTMTISSRGRRPSLEKWILGSGGTTQTSPVAGQVQGQQH
jgi:hypothetical protein